MVSEDDVRADHRAGGRWAWWPRPVVPVLAALVVLPLAAAGCAGQGSSKDSAGTSSPVPSGSTSQPSPPGNPTTGQASPAGATPTQTVDPASLEARVDNPYLPLVPGTRYRYVGDTAEGRQIEVVTVTHQTKQIIGAPAVVVRDTVTDTRGRLVEDTRDWYAQDRDGNVWYLGEDTTEYEHGKVVSTEGSWQAGVDGAVAGIVMEAHPQVGDRYQQGYYRGKAEDRAQVLKREAQVRTPVGSFDHVVVTRDYSPLEPKLVEHKYFVRGIGSVLELAVTGPKDRLELVELKRP